GLYIAATSTTSISGVRFERNSTGAGGEGSFDGTAGKSGNGGGIYNLAGATVLQGTVFDSNTTASGASAYTAAGGGNGGGLFNGAGSPTIVGCRFTNNVTGDGGEGLDGEPGGHGGGMCNMGASPFVMNSILDANTTGAGGGGDLIDMGGNGGSGAGVYNSTGSPSFVNCTFADNTAGPGGVGQSSTGTDGLGGGMRNSGGGVAPSVYNSIFWGNTASTGTELEQQISGGAPVIEYSNVQGIVGTVGDQNMSEDPVFSPSGNFSLSGGSKCIDEGDRTKLPADLFDLDGDGIIDEELPVDYAGDTRVIQDYVDMGAYECQTGCGTP
ncbi:MAG: hypothetical protein GY856_52190, partial [bacterium]|nr:hypothetical protein [bacterium]